MLFSSMCCSEVQVLRKETNTVKSCVFCNVRIQIPRNKNKQCGCYVMSISALGMACSGNDSGSSALASSFCYGQPDCTALD